MELLDQVTSVIRLSRTFGLSISLAGLARRDEPASHNYNCFMWAFGLLDRDWLNNLIPGKGDIYPRSDFAEYLVSHCLHEISERETVGGDVVVYFKNGRAVHAGTWKTGLVVSKWGLYSHLWTHGMYELPIEYGDKIRFYRRLPLSHIRDVFERWCRNLSLRQKPARDDSSCR